MPSARDFKEKSELRIFLSYFSPHKKLFFFDMACALAIALIDLAFPLYVYAPAERGVANLLGRYADGICRLCSAFSVYVCHLVLGPQLRHPGGNGYSP